MNAVKLLIVDDDSLLLKIMRQALEHEGLEIRTTTDPRECLTTVFDFRPDIVLLDG